MLPINRGFIQRKAIKNFQNYYECLKTKIVLLQNYFLFICEFIRQGQNYLFVDIILIHLPLCHVITGHHSDAAICRFSIKYMFLKIFHNSHEIPTSKKTFQLRKISVNFVKILRTPFL